MRTRTLLGMIGFNVVWSAHPAMIKLALESYPPTHAAFFRNAGALAAFLLFARPKKGVTTFSAASVWIPVSLLGFLTFCFSPIMQMTGLETARATDNAILVALEPLLTVLIARFALGERLLPVHYASFTVALAGFMMLSGLTPSQLTTGGALLTGNLLLVAALVGDASYSSLSRKLVLRHEPNAVFGAALAIGVACLLVTALAFDGLPDFSRATLRSTLALLWLGPLGTALGYLFWMIALKETTVAAVALTLFVQPLMGIVWGVLFLQEKLTAGQAAGGALILVAVFSGEAAVLRASRKAASPHRPG